MKNQKGSAALLSVVAVLGVVLCLALGAVFWAFSIKNAYVRVENAIPAAHDALKTHNTQYVLRIQQMAQVPAMARDDLKEVITAAIQGRYGKDGSKAVFQFIKEQNPSIDPSLYSNIQKEITAGTNDFKALETRVTDLKRSAKDMLDTNLNSDVLSFFGMPRLHYGYNGDKDDYPVIMTQESKDTFETGIDKGVKLR